MEREMTKRLREYLAGDAKPISKFVVPYGGCFVHNVLGTKDEPVPQGYCSVLEYWERFAGLEVPKECLAQDPHENADDRQTETNEIVGAHVRVDGEPCPLGWAWIVPLCKHCNSDDRTWAIFLPAGTVLVPVKMEKQHETAKNDMDEAIKVGVKYFGVK